jgi:glc operon protein GlcG
MELIQQKGVITLALAEKLSAVAKREILERGWRMYVAIGDESGTPVLITRVNDAQPGSFDISVLKAQCAARFRRPTKAWEERVKGGAPNVMTLPGVVASEGGVPLFVGEQAIGAVGVSGGTGAEDGVIAAAVVAELEKLVAP